MSDHGNSEYIESVVKDIVHKNFSVKVILESEADMINMDIEKEEDKGEELLKQVVDPELIEVRDSMDEE